MLWLHSCRLSFQERMGTSAGSRLLSVQMVPLHKAMHVFSISTLLLAFKAVCNKRAEPLLLFVLSHVTISCCICLTWICNRGFDTCNWGGLGDNEDSPHLLSCSEQPVMCVSVFRFYYLLGQTRDQNQNWSETKLKTATEKKKKVFLSQQQNT